MLVILIGKDHVECITVMLVEWAKHETIMKYEGLQAGVGKDSCGGEKKKAWGVQVKAWGSLKDLRGWKSV